MCERNLLHHYHNNKVPLLPLPATPALRLRPRSGSLSRPPAPGASVSSSLFRAVPRFVPPFVSLPPLASTFALSALPVSLALLPWRSSLPIPPSLCPSFPLYPCFPRSFFLCAPPPSHPLSFLRCLSSFLFSLCVPLFPWLALVTAPCMGEKRQGGKRQGRTCEEGSWPKRARDQEDAAVRAEARASAEGVEQRVEQGREEGEGCRARDAGSAARAAAARAAAASSGSMHPHVGSCAQDRGKGWAGF